MAASHVQLRLPQRRYLLERESFARTSLGFARRRSWADGGFARPAPAPTKAIFVCSGKVRLECCCNDGFVVHLGSREGDIRWLRESPARTSLGSLGVVNAADCGLYVQLGSCEGDTFWACESSAPTPLGSARAASLAKWRGWRIIRVSRAGLLSPVTCQRRDRRLRASGSYGVAPRRAWLQRPSANGLCLWPEGWVFSLDPRGN